MNAPKDTISTVGGTGRGSHHTLVKPITSEIHPSQRGPVV